MYFKLPQIKVIKTRIRLGNIGFPVSTYDHYQDIFY